MSNEQIYKKLSYLDSDYYEKLSTNYDKTDIDKYKSKIDFMYLYLDPQFNPRLYYKKNDKKIHLIATIEINKTNKLEDKKVFSVYTILDISNNDSKKGLYINSSTDDYKIISQNNYCANIIYLQNNKELYGSDDIKYDNWTNNALLNSELLKDDELLLNDKLPSDLRNIYIFTIQGDNKCGYNIKTTFMCIFYIGNIFNIKRYSLNDLSYFQHENNLIISTKFIRYFLNYQKKYISIYNRFGFKYKQKILNEVKIPFPNEITIKEIYDVFREINEHFSHFQISYSNDKVLSKELREKIKINIEQLIDYLEKNLNITFKQFIKDKPDLFYTIYDIFYIKKITYDGHFTDIMKKLFQISTDLKKFDAFLYLVIPIDYAIDVDYNLYGGGLNINIFYIIIVLLILLFYL